MAAVSAPTLSRFSGRGRNAKMPSDSSTIGSAAAIGAKLPTSRSPISHRIVRYACVKSAAYCTNRINAEKNAFNVTPASSSTIVEMGRPGLVASA